MRKAFGFILMHLIVLPLSVLLLIQMAAERVVDFCDWCASRRLWTYRLYLLAERVDDWRLR